MTNKYLKYQGHLYRIADPVVFQPIKDKDSFKDLFGFNEWVDITSDDLHHNPELLQSLFDLISNAYTDLEDGHSSLPSSISLLRDDLILHAIDLDTDPDPDAVVTWKLRDPGNKINSIGHDGESVSKKTVIQEFTKLLGSVGYYAEVSPPISDIIWKRFPNIKVIENPAYAAALLGKDIEWLGNHPDGKSPKSGWYTRKIGGKPHTKILVGIPKGVPSSKAGSASRQRVARTIKYKGAIYIRAFYDHYDFDHHNPLPLEEVARRWAVEEARPDRWGSFIALYPLEDVWQYREYDRSPGGDSNLTAKQWEELEESMKLLGWNAKEPVVMVFGKDGVAKVGEGNHRLWLAKKLGYKKVPVTFGGFWKAVEPGVGRGPVV